MKKCENCNQPINKDVNGEIEECLNCGLIPLGELLDTDDPGHTKGEEAIGSITQQGKIGGRKGPQGSTIAGKDVKSKQDRKIARSQRWNCHERNRFADECLCQLRALNLGKVVEDAASYLLACTMVECKSEEKVKPLPRNQLRFLADVDLTYRQRVVVVAILRVAAKFHYIHAVNEKAMIEEWGLKRRHVHKCLSNLLARISRMQTNGLMHLRKRNDPFLTRDEKLSNCISQIKAGLLDSGMERDDVMRIVRQTINFMRELGEPSKDGIFANTRIDTLCAIIARRAIEILGFKGYKGLVATWLDMSAGGITGRAKEIKETLDDILGPID